MNPERLKMLEQYALEDPHDPFPVYALGLEWMKSDPSKAKALFDQILKDHPGYLAVYYHAGQLYYETGNVERARELIETGIEKTSLAGDLKALAELRTLLEEIS